MIEEAYWHHKKVYIEESFGSEVGQAKSALLHMNEQCEGFPLAVIDNTEKTIHPFDACIYQDPPEDVVLEDLNKACPDRDWSSYHFGEPFR